MIEPVPSSRRSRHPSRAAAAGASRRAAGGGRRRQALGALVHGGSRAGAARGLHRRRRSPVSAPVTCCPGPCASSTSGAIVGSTRYHDIVASIDRVEIGYTWYAKSWQRSHVNTACKLLLFGARVRNARLPVVGLRTDNFNFASQRAIEALGAKKDGVIRTTRPAATARCATRSCTAFSRASGRT